MNVETTDKERVEKMENVYRKFNLSVNEIGRTCHFPSRLLRRNMGVPVSAASRHFTLIELLVVIAIITIRASSIF